jgi:hypothetical protein
MELAVWTKLVAGALTHFPKFCACMAWVVGIWADHRAQGVWCSCWSVTEEADSYEIGSLVMNQLGATVSAEFYSGQNYWTARGKLKNNNLQLAYPISDGTLGWVDLRFADEGQNTSLLKGTWLGKFHHWDENRRLKVGTCSGKLFAARDKACVEDCRIKKFAIGKEGACTTAK